MPREGTETLPFKSFIFITSFGNKMPREGTETCTEMSTVFSENYLEIRCPERGRKLFTVLIVGAFVRFGNKMPREGTETCTSRCITIHKTQFGNKMPREGTETVFCSFNVRRRIDRFGNKMPREGTETRQTEYRIL